jgi:hypothetical protein
VQAEKLGSMGVDKVICVTVDEPAKVAELAAKPGLSGCSRVSRGSAGAAGRRFS